MLEIRTPDGEYEYVEDAYDFMEVVRNYLGEEAHDYLQELLYDNDIKVPNEKSDSKTYEHMLDDCWKGFANIGTVLREALKELNKPRTNTAHVRTLVNEALDMANGVR